MTQEKHAPDKWIQVTLWDFTQQHLQSAAGEFSNSPGSRGLRKTKQKQHMKRNKNNVLRKIFKR
jgi:hypothetical protein